MIEASNRPAYAVWFGSALLTFGALFHFSGVFAIPSSDPGGGMGFFETALRPLWLFASLHWLLIALICVIASRSGGPTARAILLCCAAAVLADATLLYWFIGPFIGEIILAATGIAFMIGAMKNRADVIHQTTG